MVVYECGNFDQEEEHGECPLCGADVRDEPPKKGSTVVVNCPGWYPDEEEP